MANKRTPVFNPESTIAQHSSSSVTPHYQIGIIGTGFGGLALAKNLIDADIQNFVLFERANEVGGTWRDNTYPGCACDVASNLYSFSFAPNPDWSLTHSPQPEILEYLKGVARKFSIYPKVLFNHEVFKTQWDEKHRVWSVETNNGFYTCNVLVTATGPFGSPSIPAFQGLESFKGKSFHTARWDHACELKGKNVAVIGTGATAIQVVPELQKVVKHLDVFQRTPSYIIPRIDIQTSSAKRAAMRYIPLLQKSVRSAWYASYEMFIGTAQFIDQRFLSVFEAAANAHLKYAVKDPVLREKLTPKYRFMCKRPVFNSTFYPALQQSNVSLVTEGIKTFCEEGIIDSAGNLHKCDVVVFSTGFKTPNDVYGRIVNAKNKSLLEVWAGIPSSYMGTSYAGFPNYFSMLGPFSAPGNQSAVFMLETQARYITDAIGKLIDAGMPCIDVKADIERAFYLDAQERSKDTSWVSGGCTSYFQATDGGNVGLWPNWSFLYRWKARFFDLSKYNISPGPLTLD